MQALGARTPSEQVDAASAQLARARSRQQKADAARFDQTMHLVEEPRQPLHLIDYDDPIPPGDLLCDAFRVTAQREVGRAVEKIV